MEQAVGEHVVAEYDDGRGKKKDYEGKKKLHVFKRERKRQADGKREKGREREDE